MRFWYYITDKCASEDAIVNCSRSMGCTIAISPAGRSDAPRSSSRCVTLASRRGDRIVSAEVHCFSQRRRPRASLAPRLPFLDRRAERIEMPVIKVNNLQYPLRPGQNRLGSGDDADVKIDGL